jgi:hypothetical protein
MPAFVLYGITYLPKMPRHQFAAIMSASVGVELFLLAVMFVQSRAMLVGLVLFLLAFFGIYPVSSLLYPRYEARVEKRLTKNRKND